MEEEEEEEPSNLLMEVPHLAVGLSQSMIGNPWFVVGSHLCSEMFFSGYSGFRFSSKTNTYKFRFDLESVPNYVNCVKYIDT